MTATYPQSNVRKVAAMTANELERRQVSSDVLNDLTNLDVETVLAILTGEVDVVVHDTEGISRDIMRQILEAPSLEDILSQTPGAPGSENYIGQVLQFHDFRLMPSGFDGNAIYMIVDAVVPKTGEKLMFSTSSANIMAQLARAKWLNAMPFVGVIRRADKKTTAGFYPLRIAAPVE